MTHRVVIALALAVSLCACGGPDPTKLRVQLDASPQLNPNSEKQFSPTVVRVYELKSIDKFNSATFFQLYDNDAAILGGDLLNRSEMIVLPGETKKLDSVANDATGYVGVMAAFRDLNGSNWRTSLKVEPHDLNKMILSLQTTAVTLAKPKPSHFLWIF